MQSDIQQSLAWLEWWRPGGPWVLTTIPVDRRAIQTCTWTAAETDQLVDWLEAKVTDGWNVYYHVNPTLSPLGKKAEVVDIASLDWLHVDVDPEPGQDIDQERERILSMLQDRTLGLPEPSAIVFSGGGYQAYWRLAEPLPLNGDRTKAEDASRYNQQVELLLGADRCHNVDRIMRLPGTVNWPNDKKRKRGQEPALSFVVAQSGAAYPIDRFTKATERQDSTRVVVNGPESTRVVVSGNVAPVDLDSLPAEVDSRVKSVIVQGHDPDQRLNGPDQSRSAWLLFVCGALVRAGVDDDTVYSIITCEDYGISASVLDKGNSAQVHRYATRQIQRAKEHKEAPELMEMNDKYAVVESIGGRSRIAKEVYDHDLGHPDVQFLLPDGFKLTHCNRKVAETRTDANGNQSVVHVTLGKWWLEHPARRTYESVVFQPERQTPGQLNLWRGFAFDAIPGDCSLFLEHCRRVLCRGNEDHYQYLMGWMARKVQHPGKPAQTAVVIHGKQGTGKGTFAHHFGALFGVHYKHVVNPDHVTGQFNNVLRDACVVFADECFRKEKRHVSALKSLITEPTLRVEAKGVDSLAVRNCVGMILATNEDWAVMAELDDRRFFVLHVGDDHRRDSDYFGAIQKQMDDGGYQALMHYLASYDLANFNVREVPTTDALKSQQRHSMSDMEAWWYEVLESGRQLPELEDWGTDVPTNQLVDSVQVIGGTKHSTAVRVGMFLTKMVPGLAKVRSSQAVKWTDSKGRERYDRRPWVWRFPDLAACRARWDSEYGAQLWPEIVPMASDDEGHEARPF